MVDFLSKSMVKDSLIALLTLTVAGWIVFPALPAQASTGSVVSADTVIANIATAESVAFDIDLDVKVQDTRRSDHSIEVHAEIDGATDFEKQTEITGHVTSSDAGETVYDANGFMKMIGNTLYLSDDHVEWYAVELDDISSVPAPGNVKELQSFFNDLLDHGVITYHVDGFEFLHGAATVRYVYAIDHDRLVAYVRDSHKLSDREAEQLRTVFDGTFAMSGEVWIDTLTMLPKMFTVNISSRSTSATHATINMTVRFKNVNVPLQLVAPTNVMNIEDIDWSSSTNVFNDHLTRTVAQGDVDGDGLTNAEEKFVWFSHPLKADTDGDGYMDATEVLNGYDPNGIGVLDSDGDGLTDYAEMTVHWSDRFDADSDDDGYPDGTEIANGYNPNGPGRW